MAISITAMSDDLPELSQCEDALRVAVDHGQWDTEITAKVRSMVGEQMAATVLATAKLQSKARGKLGDGLWWCSERSLSQSTPFQVAQLKARWLQSDCIVDLCCGIGGDTVSIANRVPRNSRVVAVDSDPTIAEMAHENLRLNLQRDDIDCSVLISDASEADLPGNAAVHIDPDRRDGESRKTRPEDYSPAWSVVRGLLSRCESGIVKLAPAAELDAPAEFHRSWISLSGSVREQTLLTGKTVELASADLGVSLESSRRSAIIVQSDGSHAVYVASSQIESADRTDQPDRFMVDPDAAIRAAGLTESFACRNELRTLGKAAGFLTGPTATCDNLAICERVIWSGACDDRKLRKTLRSMNCYPWRIKTRGVSQNPNVLEKRYRECGEKPITLWIGKGSKRQYAAITESVPSKVNA